MDKKELLRLIDQAADEGWEELDLRDQGLRELPPEIGKLQRLTWLYLSRKKQNSIGNNLHTLPPEIGQLANLTQLHLYNNQLTAEGGLFITMANWM